MMIAAKFRFRSRLGVFFGLLVVMAPPILDGATREQGATRYAGMSRSGSWCLRSEPSPSGPR